ncbi:MAG: hypothetical protein E7582_02965 [Ruminococcaceae bacterium]|nr:hypothetical protein [Oscillospiraceae bacterium]
MAIFERKETLPTQYDAQNDKTILYYNADFNENIYNDEVFVELMNMYALEFINGDSAYKLQVEDLETYGGDLAVFFYDFFTTVRNGDHEKYNSYFDSRAFKNREKASQFTMQQIYEISIKELDITPEFEDEYAWVSDASIEPIYVDVRYKIRKNNGTFRLGVESDTVKPQMYIIYKTNNSFKIIDILEYAPVYS